MEIDPSTTQSSSRSANTVSTNTAADSTTTRPIRSSARVRAAKEEKASIIINKGKGKARDFVEEPPKKKTRRSTATTALVINEPIKDPKGKKRALPDPEEDDDEPPPPKRVKTSISTYSLRVRKPAQPPPPPPPAKPTMTKKTKAAKKATETVANDTGANDEAGPSTTRDDVEMTNAEEHSDGDENDHDDENGSGDEEENPPAQSGAGGGNNDSAPADEAAVSMFADYQSLSSYMLTISSRLKTILTNIKPKADPTTRLLSLQELSEILSMGTEDTLSGYLQIDAFVKELVRIMGGGTSTDGEGDEDGEPKEEEMDEDAALAAALAMSSGSMMSDGDLEAQMLACRCLANLMEALPGCAHTVVYHGAVPVLCSKLIAIEYIDLAEQTISTLEKISQEYPSAIVREDGLGALLNFLDFFSTNVQRTALQAAANCCRNASPDSFSKISSVFPIIRTVLSYSDQRLVEFACLCVIRTIESYHRNQSDLLETLVDAELIRAINMLLLPAGGSPNISPNTFTLLLRVLATAAKASPKIAVALLEADIVSTLYQILAGVVPPLWTDEDVGAEGGQGFGGGFTDMAVMQNLGRRPKDQVEEALSLISELMPPLPKDSVFDHRAYTEKSLARLIKAKNKADKAERNARAAVAVVAVAPLPTVTPSQATPIVEDAATPGPSSQGQAPTGAPTSEAKDSSNVESKPDTSDSKSDAVGGSGAGDETASGTVSETPAPPVKEPPVSRAELLKSKPEVVGRFMRLIVPVLVDVYAASVAFNVRTKTLIGLLKATSFLEGGDLQRALKIVPVATFAGSILSSKDHPTLIIGILQFVELVLIKLPVTYKPSLRREGVLHEIETLAEQELTVKIAPPPAPTPVPAPPELDASAPPDVPSEVPSDPPPAVDSPVPPAADSPAPPAADTADVSPPSVVDAAEVPAPPVADAADTSIPAPSTDTDADAAATASAEALAQPTTDTQSTPPIPVPTPLPPKKSSSTPLDPADAITMRARVMRFKYLASGPDAEGDATLAEMSELVKGLRRKEANENELKEVLSGVGKLFENSETSVSSFELLKSGLVDALLEFAILDGWSLDALRRQQLMLEVLATKGGSAGGHSPMATLVRKLQESLTRMESFEVVSVSNGLDDSKRNAASMLARQIRLRLVADESSVSEIPKNCATINVSIHAIATFQALNDYLRPRVAGQIGSGSGWLGGASGSRLSGIMAALRGAAGGGNLASLSSALAAAGAAASGSGSAEASSSSAAVGTTETAPATASSSKAEEPKGKETPTKDAKTKTVGRRRSMRLSALKNQPVEGTAGASTSTSAPEPSTSAPEPSTSAPEPSTSVSAPKSPTSPIDEAIDTLMENVTATSVLTDGASAGPSTEEAKIVAQALALAQTLMDVDDQDDFMEDEFDTEVFEEEMEHQEAAVPDATVNVAVAEAEGGDSANLKVEAQTPHGTRVATPNPAAAASSSTAPPVPSAQSTPSKPSYAAALKARPTDWHLEFSMDELTLPLDLTVYGAVHQHEVRRTGNQSPAPNAIWNGVFTVKFKKVLGLPPLPPDPELIDTTYQRSGATPLLASLPEDQPHSKILRLLRVLHRLNAQISDHLAIDDQILSLPESAFVNNKLTAKLARQLEEPMIVASSCLPDWALDLPQHFPFLFPFTTRYAFLQSTSFGYARLILKWQSQQTRNSDSSRRDDHFGFLGRLQRQKVRISRKHVLESAIKVFELYGSSSSVLEVEYFEEVGTGLGPTLEFYSLVSREFARRDLNMWRDADSTKEGLYVHHPTGLFPAPLKVAEKSSADGQQKRTAIFKVLGQFIAKALLDSRILDISLNKIFVKLILGQEVPLTLASLKAVDPTLALSLSQLQAYARDRKKILSDESLPELAKQQAIAGLSVGGAQLEDLSLDFTVPGYSELELKAGGVDISVDATNVEEYVQLVLDALVGQGAQAQAQAFREGFSKVFPITDLQTFSADELVVLFGNAEEDWTVETLTEALKADHGFNVESRAIHHLLDLMAGFDQPSRRDYLQFITGSPKLPIGGFKGLNPPLTVVRKPHEAPLRADDYLPSVMTCVNYLKLPEYSSKRVMEEKLRVAMKEGVGSFHLS